MMNTTKKEQIREMFDEISPKYDFLNHFLSLGIDVSWRRKLVQMLAAVRPSTILDVATGTGDLAIALASIKPQNIVGIDISEKMLEVGRAKVTKAGLEKMITLRRGDAEKIPFSDNSFHAITVAFGVRNFENLGRGLTEMRRVLRPGGHAMILEFSHPEGFLMRPLYRFYSRFIIPSVGRLFSKNRMAYNYLPESVAAFPSGENFIRILNETGYHNARRITLSQGIATIYMAEK